jgi:serine/threonine protein phosphatase PrpC
VAGADLCLVADGLGGLLRGGEAAELVTNYAQERLTAELPQVFPAGPDGVRALLLAVIWDAAKALSQEALMQGWSGADVGLRTTLILAVTMPEYYVVVWIGDGGVFVMRTDNTLVAVLEPHKDPKTPNVLHSSLGPSVEGRPSWAIAARQHGDILVAATDGIADACDAALVERVRQCIEKCQGDTAQAAREVVEEVAKRRDDAGDFEITDNLTLAILMGSSS